MTCNSSMTTFEQTGSGAILALRICVLVMLLILGVGGNVVLYLHSGRNGSSKWLVHKWILRKIAVVGLLNGTLNIPAYIVTLVSGHWYLGMAVCQVYGVTTSVLTSSWIWLLTIAALERYKRLSGSHDHSSLFSEANAKIVTWGTILLLLVLFLGPIYGWGEYSGWRGSVDLSIGVQNYTITPFLREHNASLTHMLAPSEFIVDSIKDLLSAEQSIDLRKLRIEPDCVVFPLRLADHDTASCFWQNYSSGLLHEKLSRVIMTNNTRMALHTDDLRINVTLNEEEVRSYTQSYLIYQAFSSCGLDYSPVNDNIYTFVGLSWFCILLLPLVSAIVLYVRIFFPPCWKAHDLRHGALDITAEDLHLAHVLAYSTFISFFCYLVYHMVCLCSGLGVAISEHVHYLATVLLTCSWTVVSLIYVCSSSDCQTLLPGCAQLCHVTRPSIPCATRGESNSRGTRDFDVKTRLLSAPRTVPSSYSGSPAMSSTCLSNGSDKETAV